MNKKQVRPMHTEAARAKRMRSFKRTMREKRAAKLAQKHLPAIIATEGEVLRPNEIPLHLIPERPTSTPKSPWKQGKSLNEEQARLILAAETIKLLGIILQKDRKG